LQNNRQGNIKGAETIANGVSLLKITMKLTIFALVACFFILQIAAFPLEEAATAKEIEQGEHIRVKRVTCDILSVEAKGVKLNDAACAAHCLFRGRSGGYCNGKRVCVCR
jgi:hypothetical protein